jgi:hypothetical protein
VPPGPLLLAEIDGEPWAAIALDGGRPIADPFRPTAALVDLLRRRAAQLAQARMAEPANADRQSRPHLAAAQEPRRLRRRRASAALGGRAARA